MSGTLKCPARCLVPDICPCIQNDEAGMRCTMRGKCPKGIDKKRVGRRMIE